MSPWLRKSDARTKIPNAAVSLLRGLAMGCSGLSTILLAASLAMAANSQPVNFTHGTRVWPTYIYSRELTEAPLFKSVDNAGFYPYTAFDWESRSEKPSPVTYDSLVLENEYLRLEFLPELGGRIWSAYDKVTKRELFYHPTVIKPGRYNARNNWPVGNLELYGPYDSHMITWPGEPWPWSLVRHPDGSVTVILTHIDHFFRDKISLEVTLHPGKAYLELTTHLYNKNLLPNRYLIWTNAGVKAYENSRFVYPMTKTIGHVSSAIREWPIIDGVDLSWNKNNKNMLGVFGLDIDDNFMSIYDSGNDFGTVCYTNRMLARGEKTWTFGSGLTAYRQAENYTDKDGIYMETQSGRFIWDGNYEFIDPGMSDGWTEYWFGANKLGGLTTATKDVAINFEIPSERPGTAKLAVSPTGAWPGAIHELYAGDQKVWSQTADLTYGQAFHVAIPLGAETAGKVLELKILSDHKVVLLDHKFYPNGERPDASYASDSIPRKWGALESLNVEEAYQKGLSNEKFGQIADAERAYNAALAKDPLFSPAHLRLGLLALDRFQVEQAVEHFEKVLERDPSNGDAHYFLGVSYAELGKHLDARRNYYRILPNSDKYNLRDYGLGLLALNEGTLDEASQKLSAAAALNPENVAIREANAYLLRKEGREADAEKERKAILELDPTNAFAEAEGWIPSGVHATSGAEVADLLDRDCAHHPQGYLELATEYFRLSAWPEAAQVLDRGVQATAQKDQAPYPLLLYYRAYAVAQSGNQSLAREFAEKASKQDLKIVIFPFRAEDVAVLKTAMQVNPNDANAPTLLGDLLYSRNREDEAMQLWSTAVQADPHNYSALRDSGMANLSAGKQEEGLALLTRASEAHPSNADTSILVANVSASLGHTEQARQAFERLLKVQPDSDQVLQKLASLEAQMGDDPRALEIMNDHRFQATHLSYSLLHLYRGVRLMLALDAAQKSQFPNALADVASAANPPSSLGVDDFSHLKSSRLLMYDALLQQAAGNTAAAQADWQAAAQTLDDDIEGEGLFRAIALYKIGQVQKAEAWFKDFAVVNEQRKTDSAVNIRLHAYDLAGIYAAMQGHDGAARDDFQKALEIDQSYLYARQSMAWLEAGMFKDLK
jgi:Tfp pilus assembly protein PilF